jgi:hypothetical protein
MRGRTSLAVLAACLMLAGCGGSPEPKSLPTSSPSPSASASPTPPVMPAAAKEKTKAGASAAARHFLESMKYSGQTGDVSAFEASYTQECTKCQGIADGIAATYRDGGSIDGGAWVPKRVKFYGIKGDIASLDVVVDYEPQTWIKKAGAPKTTSPPRSNVLKTFQLIWRDGRWRVGALDPEA